MTPLPADGTAVILHLIEAARAVAGSAAPLATLFDTPMTALQQQIALLEAYLAGQIPDEQASGWEPRTWAEVAEGDRVSLGGVEADVKQALLLQWHVDPDKRVWHVGKGAVDETGGLAHCRGCKGFCSRTKGFQNFGLEHTQMRVTLEFGGQVNSYSMPTGAEIEVLRGERGREIDRAQGRAAGAVKADRQMVLESWAAEALQTLEAAGLSPEPQVMM